MNYWLQISILFLTRHLCFLPFDKKKCIHLFKTKDKMITIHQWSVAIFILSVSQHTAKGWCRSSQCWGRQGGAAPWKRTWWSCRRGSSLSISLSWRSTRLRRESRTCQRSRSSFLWRWKKRGKCCIISSIIIVSAEKMCSSFDCFFGGLVFMCSYHAVLSLPAGEEL